MLMINIVKRLPNYLLSLVCLFIMSGGRAFSQAPPSASATGHVLAEIISVFSASEKSQMNFGRFAPGPDGGEIILTPESTISVLGNLYQGPGAHTAASFYVSGDIDASYTITLPAAPVVLTHTSSARTLKVENWVSVPAPGIGAGRLQNGFQVVFVGASLKVGNLYDNPVGVYSGTYTITFDFN
jgi:hypothetical protein